MPEPIDISTGKPTEFEKLMLAEMGKTNRLLGQVLVSSKEGEDDDWEAVIDKMGSKVNSEQKKEMEKWAKTLTDQLSKFNVTIGKTMSQQEIRKAALSKLVEAGATEAQKAEYRKTTLGERPGETAKGRGIIPELTTKAEFVLQEWLKKGNDITKLDNDYEALLKLRMESFKLQMDANTKLGATTMKQKEKMEALRLATEAEHKAHVAITKSMDKAQAAYEKGSERITGAVANIPFIGEHLSKSLGKYFDRPDVKEKLTASIGSKIRGGGLLGKAAEGAAGAAPATLGGAIGMGAGLAALAGLAVLAAMLVKLFVELVGLEIKLNSEIAKTVGISGQFAHDMEKTVELTRTEAMLLGMSKEEAHKATLESMAAMQHEMGVVTNVNAENTEMVFAIAKGMGISAGEAAKFTRFLQDGLGMSVKSSKSFLANLKGTAEVAGVSFVQAMGDVAGSSNEIATYWHGTNRQLAQAIVNARIMGTSLKSQLATAESFATFEGAAQNAMTLQVLGLGKFNALQMFTTANYGDASKLQDQILGALEKEGNWNKMNIMQRRELAKILGVEVGQVMQLVEARKREAEVSKIIRGVGLGSLKGEELALAKGAVRRLEAQGFTGESIDKKAVTQQQDKMRGEMAKNKEMEEAIASTSAILGLGDQIDPMTKAMAAAYTWLVNFLQPAVTVIKDAVIGIANILTRIFGSGKTYEADKELMKGGIELTKEESRMVQQNLASLRVTAEGQAVLMNNLSGLAIRYGAKEGEMPEKPSPAANVTAIGTGVIPGGFAEGGIVNQPSIAGEAGPEAILPLSGKGKNDFTIPFLKKAEAILPLSGKGKNDFTIPFLKKALAGAGTATPSAPTMDYAKIDKLTDMLSQFLGQPIQITTKVNVDGREIAKSLSERSLATG